MASIKQLPAALDLECVAGNPLAFTITSTGATITSPVVTMTTSTGDAYTTDPGVPTTVSQSGADTSIVWAAADTAALNATTRDKVYKWSLQATVDGEGPYELCARTLTVHPPGTAGLSTPSAVDLAVTVGGTPINLSISIGATNGGSGATNLAYTASPTQGVVTSDTGTDATLPLADSTNAGLMAPAQVTKLTGIASGAQVNTVDSVNGQTGTVVLDPDDLDDTSTTNKFTTAADISKLAGIESGATADQSAAEILAALLTVDGSGSGLDADLLDGTSSAGFATAGHNHDATYQPLDSDLTAIAALSTTPYGRAVLELANQAALMALLSASSATASGIVELATSAETITGTDTVRAVTPAGAAAAFAGLTHATRHQSGGSDAIKLDDLAAPDDNTDLNASTSAHGLLRKLTGGTSNFLREDGTWAAPPSAPGITRVYKAADESVAASTTVQDDDDFVFAVGANEKWVAQLVLFMGGTSVGDSKLAFTAPTGSTVTWNVIGPRNSDVLLQTYAYVVGSGTELAVEQRDATYLIVVYLSVAVSSTAGNVQFRWAQNSASSTTTIKAGSFMIAQKVS